MTTILHITSSISGENGVSTRLSDEFVAGQRLEHPGAVVIRRDLAKDPVPHLDAERFGAFLAKPGTAARDALRRLVQPERIAA